jgi:hypothetical protein
MLVPSGGLIEQLQREILTPRISLCVDPFSTLMLHVFSHNHIVSLTLFRMTLVFPGSQRGCSFHTKLIICLFTSLLNELDFDGLDSDFIHMSDFQHCQISSTSVGGAYDFPLETFSSGQRSHARVEFQLLESSEVNLGREQDEVRGRAL